jgi:REP-associated tyrosine transposase
MKSQFDPRKHHRRSIRLKGYDYSLKGAYYVTLVTLGLECLFGDIVKKEIYVSKYGEIVQKWWDEIPIHFPNAETSAFAVMSNHIHGIIFIIDERWGEVLSPYNNSNQDNQEHIVDKEISHIEDISLKQGRVSLPLRKPTLGQIVAYFKYQSTKEMNKIEDAKTTTKFWQRNYYEHIIRNEKELKQKTDYILDNPSHWDEDAENPLKR